MSVRTSLAKGATEYRKNFSETMTLSLHVNKKQLKVYSKLLSRKGKVWIHAD